MDRKVFFAEDRNRRGEACSSSETFLEAVSMLLALVALDGTEFTGLEREVLLLLPLKAPWLAKTGEEFVTLAELADEVLLLLLLRSGVLGSTVIGSVSALAELRRESSPYSPDFGTFSGAGSILATLAQLGHETLELAMLQSRSDTSTAAGNILSGSVDSRTEMPLLLLSPESCKDTRGGRRLPKLADRLEKPCTVDAERYELPSTSRE
jgi:hypothetical protein